MAIRYTVRRGDSLWGLACRYLGSGTRYPLIMDEHNKEVARFGPHGRLLPIKDPNLIFVGQTILVPPRKKKSQPGNGKRHEANNTATGLQVKVVCKTVKESKNWQYETRTPDYTIKASMTATISIENLSRNRYRYNLELSVSKNKLELNQKLNDFNNRAFKDLADGVKMAYESGRVTIKVPIATHAKVGPYTFDVRADAPNHFSGSVKFEPLSGTVENEQRKFKYAADVEFNVSVTVHPTPKAVSETVEVPAKNQAPFKAKTNNSINWAQVAQNTGDFVLKLTIIVLGTLTLQALMAASIGTTTSSVPLMHRIDLNDPRLGLRKPGMI